MRVVGAADSKCQEAPPNEESPSKYICAKKQKNKFGADSAPLNFCSDSAGDIFGQFLCFLRKIVVRI